MATMHELRGVDKVLNSFRDFAKATERKAELALLKGGLHALRLSQKIVPVDTAALKNSGRVRVVGRGFTSRAMIEYTMAYAIYVHENLKARHAPGKQAKFVESVLRKYRKEIIAIIRKAMGLR